MTCPDPVHDHDQRCWWDHLRCGWVCPPARPHVARPEPQREPAIDRGPGHLVSSRR